MPNIITHCLFGEDVLNQLHSNETKEILKNNYQEFMIGCNGPDFFFFYKFFKKQYASFRELGSLVHAQQVNHFYEIAIQQINSQQNSTMKAAMSAYVMGHLCHWALDSSAHPYIFYKTGKYSGLSESMHHRFESMLDAMMLKEKKGLTIQQFDFPSLSKTSPNSVKAIANIYIPIMKEVYNETITEKQIQDALNDWYHIQKLLKDPTGIKTKILKCYEKQKQHPWLYSGNIIPSKIDETYDVLNLQKKQWCYPVDETKISHETFIEIYNRASLLAVLVIECMHNIHELSQIIDNRSYDTGSNERKDMVNFDLIYGDCNENI